MGVFKCGLCNLRLCICVGCLMCVCVCVFKFGLCNVLACLCVGCVIYGCVYVWFVKSVGVFMCGFLNVYVCISVVFVMFGLFMCGLFNVCVFKFGLCKV